MRRHPVRRLKHRAEHKLLKLMLALFMILIPVALLYQLWLLISHSL